METEVRYVSTYHGRRVPGPTENRITCSLKGPLRWIDPMILLERHQNQLRWQIDHHIIMVITPFLSVAPAHQLTTCILLTGLETRKAVYGVWAYRPNLLDSSEG